MAILTKSDILKGIKNVQKVHIESLGGELYLRPLSSAELDEINCIEAEGMGVMEQNIKGAQLNNTVQSSKINVLKITKASAKAKYEMIRMSLDNDKNTEPWETEEIQELSKDAVEELYKKVQEISKVEITEVDVKNFP